MTDCAKSIVSNENWPAPKRSSFVYSMSQKERIRALAASRWPNLDWSNEWIHLFEQEVFDRQIAVDARSGMLQEAFNVRTFDDVKNEEDGKAYLKKIASRDRLGTPLAAIECRDDGKYIKGTNASLRTWLEYEEEGQEDRFFEEYNVPKKVEKLFYE